MLTCSDFYLRRKDRKRLKKSSNFLTSNRSWLCEGECKRRSNDYITECQTCLIEGLIRYSLKVNKKCCRSTFANSVMQSQFIKIEGLYKYHFEKKRMPTFKSYFERKKGFFRNSDLKIFNCVCRSRAI